MKTIKLTILFFAFNIPYLTFCQNDCNLNMTIGEWKMINLIHWGVYTNVDSLKSISLSHQSDKFVTIEFKEDSTYLLRFTENNKTKTGYYFTDKKTCELILNRSIKNLNNIKYREQSNWEIIYIDNEIFIYKEDKNPKSIATRVLMRK